MERSAANAENPGGHDQDGDSDEGYRAVDTALETNPSTDAELLAASTPRLHAVTRSQDLLAGGNTSLEDLYPRCRRCPACQDPDCQIIHGANLFSNGCSLCRNNRDLLCQLRKPCASWDEQRNSNFRDAREALQITFQPSLIGRLTGASPVVQQPGVDRRAPQEPRDEGVSDADNDLGHETEPTGDDSDIDRILTESGATTHKSVEEDEEKEDGQEGEGE